MLEACSVAPNCLGKVHSGLQLAVEYVVDQVKEGVKQAQIAHPGYTLVLTGHSLGGALAQLVGVALAAEGLDFKIVTFGSFRVGDPEFAQFAQGEVEHYRVTAERDLVTFYPFNVMGYQHSGQELWFDGSDLKVCGERH